MNLKELFQKQNEKLVVAELLKALIYASNDVHRTNDEFVISHEAVVRIRAVINKYGEMV